MTGLLQRVSHELGRDAGLTVARLRFLQERVGTFLSRAPLERSVLMLDGPGLGCAGQCILLALVGDERIKRLAAVHSFSASSLILLVSLAKAEGMLGEPEACVRWFKDAQARHRIVPGVSLARAVGQKLRGEPYIFPAEQNGRVLEDIVAPAFRARTIASLPPNLHFWCYEETQGTLVDVHASSPQSHWTMDELMQAMCGVPRLWAPLCEGGKVYSDVLWAPGVRSLFKQLRGRSSNVLFSHMHREGESRGTIFVKPHEQWSGYSRVTVDFGYFMLGLPNPNMSDAIRLGLFELDPVKQP